HVRAGVPPRPGGGAGPRVRRAPPRAALERLGGPRPRGPGAAERPQPLPHRPLRVAARPGGRPPPPLARLPGRAGPAPPLPVGPDPLPAPDRRGPADQPPRDGPDRPPGPRPVALPVRAWRPAGGGGGGGPDRLVRLAADALGGPAPAVAALARD